MFCLPWLHKPHPQHGDVVCQGYGALVKVEGTNPKSVDFLKVTKMFNGCYHHHHHASTGRAGGGRFCSITRSCPKEVTLGLGERISHTCSVPELGGAEASRKVWGRSTWVHARPKEWLKTVRNGSSSRHPVPPIGQSGLDEDDEDSLALCDRNRARPKLFQALSHTGQNYRMLIGLDRGHFCLITRALLVIKRAWLLDDWLSMPALNWFPTSNGFWKGISEMQDFWVWSKHGYFIFNQNYNKILKRDWLSAAQFEH